MPSPCRRWRPSASSADGPTAIYLSGKLAPELLGPSRWRRTLVYGAGAVNPAAPIMRALTSEKERKIRTVQLRTVSKREKSFRWCASHCWWRCCCRTPRRCWDVLLWQFDAQRRVERLEPTRYRTG
ncbi:sodium ion-translocating decarboxylase subunit beta [Salmonella enterica subsp. enterica serovar Weltevreden]|nr:sodium ion-translocating decarboxylase subunit beta [Salmonella enterica subsp. enterica serovar Weltevreden]